MESDMDTDTDTDTEFDAESEHEIEKKAYWYSNLALFGDSNVALFFSFSMLVLSFLVSLYTDGNLPSAPWNRSPSERAYRNLEPLQPIAPPKIFHASDLVDNKVSMEIQESFDRVVFF